MSDLFKGKIDSYENSFYDEIRTLATTAVHASENRIKSLKIFNPVVLDVLINELWSKYKTAQTPEDYAALSKEKLLRILSKKNDLHAEKAKRILEAKTTAQMQYFWFLPEAIRTNEDVKSFYCGLLEKHRLSPICRGANQRI